MKSGISYLKHFSLTFALVCQSALSEPQQHTIIVNVPHWTPGNSKIYISGQTQQFCKWKTPCLDLKQLGPFTYSIRVDANEAINDFEFKITRGSWKNEASHLNGKALSNFVFRPEEEELVINIAHWKDLRPRTIPNGNLVILNNFYSPQLDNYRTVRVWLPPSYKKDTNKYYPVVYWQDGQNLFDPRTSSYGVDWSLDETLSEMITNQEIGEAIVVGIDSTSNRFSEYDPNDLGLLYLDFVVGTLKPYIDNSFRTRRGRHYTSVAGSSMGALISFAALWKFDMFFSRALAVSLPAAIRKNTLDIFMNKNPHPPRFPIRLWMDHGGKGTDANYKIPAQKFYDQLSALGLASRVSYKVYPYAKHEESDWARRAPEFLSWLLSESAVEISNHNVREIRENSIDF